MAKRTHLWLLEQAAPQEPAAVAPHLRRQLEDPGVLPLPFAWLRVLVAILLVRLRLKTYQDVLLALPGPVGHGGGIEALSLLVQQQLGRRYRCMPVLRFGRPDAATAAAEVARGEQVVLLPLQLVQDDVSAALLREARAALGPRRASLAEVRDLAEDPGVIEVLAQCIRRAILSLPPDTAYEVLFCAFARGRDLGSEIEARVAALTRALRLNRRTATVRLHRFGLGPQPLAGLEPYLDRLSRDPVPAVVLVPLGPLVEQVELRTALGPSLEEALCARGVKQVVRAEPPGADPDLARALARQVQAAERAMEWQVPEDDIRVLVEAELARIQAGPSQAGEMA